MFREHAFHARDEGVFCFVEVFFVLGVTCQTNCFLRLGKAKWTWWVCKRVSGRELSFVRLVAADCGSVLSFSHFRHSLRGFERLIFKANRILVWVRPTGYWPAYTLVGVNPCHCGIGGCRLRFGFFCKPLPPFSSWIRENIIGVCLEF